MKQSFNNLLALVFALAVLLFLQIAPLNAQTNFVKDTLNNPILPLGNPGEWDDTEASFANVLYNGSTYQMWYSGAPQQDTYRIGYATSSDGLTWNKPANNLVLDVGSPGAFDDEDVWLPAVLFDGTSYEMWYTGNLSTGGGIGYIITTDPTVWARQRSIPVLTGDFGAWDQSMVLNPVVLHNDTLYQMWYSGLSASGLWQTGYATSMDGITWSKDPANPVLTVGAFGEWDAVAAMAGSVVFADGQYQMWYHGTTGDAFSDWEIGYATSSDGINWTKYDDPATPNPPHTQSDPILSPGLSGSWDANQVGFPCVIKEGDRYRMWYQGRSTFDIDRLGYAEDTSAVVGIKVLNAIQPEHFHLKQNYPNPFNPSTNIEFFIPKSDFVTLRICNTLGEEVATLVSERLAAGKYNYEWDAGEIASGVYLCRIQAGNYMESKKMVLLR